MIGKAIGGGIPIGAYGISAEVADADRRPPTDADIVDVGGVGGTLAGNALSLAAARATLAQVLTAEAFARMIDAGDRFAAGVARRLDRARRAVVDLAARRPRRVPVRARARRARRREAPRPRRRRDRATTCTSRCSTAAS